MPLLIPYSLSGLLLDVVATSEVVAVEIIRTLVGSIGLVAAVPITTWLPATHHPKLLLSQATPQAPAIPPA